MPPRFRLIYFAHSLRSDWNNGNAHFLRGLMRSMVALGHSVTIFEHEDSWSFQNLCTEPLGQQSLKQFSSEFTELHIETYTSNEPDETWLERLTGADIVILHEWNPFSLAQRLLSLREDLGFALLFHDTHHRASSSPDQIQGFGLDRFNGVIAFGEILRSIYRERFNITNVWTLHEAADVSVFHPTTQEKQEKDVVWIGNWGDGERSIEIREYLLKPAQELQPEVNVAIYGVRYPHDGLAALQEASVRYGGYLPNLDAPAMYGAAGLTVHIPRQQYASEMLGIPTIRVFEALACGIPLISAPWQDTEQLFRPGDLCFVENGRAMMEGIQKLLRDPAAATDQTQRGLETILERHTCDHRARELTAICEELL